MTYYNTTPLSGTDLQTATGKAKYQDDRILEYFKDHPTYLLSPEDVLEAVFTSSTPLTSIRRSFTNLTTGLFIEKAGKMKQGLYGRPVNTWRLRTNNNQLQLL